MFALGTGVIWFPLLALLLPAIAIGSRLLAYREAGGLLDDPWRRPRLLHPGGSAPLACCSGALALLISSPLLRGAGALATLALLTAWARSALPRLRLSPPTAQGRPVRRPTLRLLVSPFVRVGSRWRVGPKIDWEKEAPAPSNAAAGAGASLIGSAIAGLAVIVESMAIIQTASGSGARGNPALDPVFSAMGAAFGSQITYATAWAAAAGLFARARIRRTREQCEAIAAMAREVERKAREQGLGDDLREAPVQRHGNRDPSLADLAALPCAAGFGGSALKRAVELDPYLSAEARKAMRTQLFDIATTSRATPAHERAMLARCIMETDADYELRFRFLELEGQLEAEAAEAWWRQRHG